MQLTKSIFKTGFLAFLFYLILFSISLTAEAITIQEVPAPHLIDGGWVTDMANPLSSDTETELNKIISEFERKTSTEIAVVTVLDTACRSSSRQFA
ncbi:TPM domain-containing protein [Chlorogloeopsis sp. ULAP02]|uniref:TPM domain-containing protein n=1 Tax=Chlorogloeopsis sp. ULAP02 TaxID=3107926 RepID=UPI00313766F1